jgi:hypothetical protein
MLVLAMQFSRDGVRRALVSVTASGSVTDHHGVHRS